MAEGTQKHHRQAPECAAKLITVAIPFGSDSAIPRLAAIRATASGFAERFCPRCPITYPQRITTSPAPIECEVFQSDIFVASSVGGIQWVSSRAQGGNPDPCSNPFTIHMMPMKRIIVLVKRSPVCSPVIQVEMSSPNPKAKLARAQSARPMAIYQRAFMRSARMPFTKRERP